MKKLIVILLVLVLCLSVCACGSKPAETDKTPAETEKKPMAYEPLPSIARSGEEQISEFDENHPLYEKMFGEWKLVTEKTANDPYESLIMNADKTCVVDGKEGIWKPTAMTTADVLVLRIEVDGEFIGSAKLTEEKFTAMNKSPVQLSKGTYEKVG